MAEEREAEVSKRQEITRADITAFLKDKGAASKPCLQCGTNKWILLWSEEKGWHGHEILIRGTGEYVRKVTHAFALACDNCGYLRFFGLPPVEEWLDKQRKAGEKP